MWLSWKTSRILCMNKSDVLTTRNTIEHTISTVNKAI